ncbi:MAG: biotin-independent malonate decarboxylase subunit gamma [Oxalobacter sp.]
MAEKKLSRGDIWFDIMTKGYTVRTGQCASVRVADGEFDGKPARMIAVVPDPDNHYPRAAKGEVGLLEGWTLGKVVAEAVEQDKDKDRADKRAIIAIIDVPSQAYGRREEAFGIHLALAAAAGAYATARLAGHPVIGLIVGKAMSGAFLAHGYQANRLIAFNDKDVLIHAMGKASAARITKRTVDSLEELASTIPPMAYDISNYAKLGLLENLLDIADPSAPTSSEINQVVKTVKQAVVSARNSDTSLDNRLGSPNRAGTVSVRRMMREQWAA